MSPGKGWVRLLKFPDDDDEDESPDPEERLLETPAPRVYRRVNVSQKRKSDVSCSVAGANLQRKRRRIVGDDPVNPSTATDGEMKRTEVFEYFGNPEKLTLEQGQVVMERRLKELDLTLSPSQKVTPADGNCLFHLLLDQTRYIPDLNDFASNSI